MQNKRILFVTIPEKGHINPMIGVAQQLQARGFELAFFSQGDISEQLRLAGLFQQVFSNPDAVTSTTDFITKGQAFVEKLKDRIWLRSWIKTLLIDSVPDQVRLIKAAAETFRPELIVADPMIYAAVIAASQLDIPWVGLSSSLNPITPDHWQCELTGTLDELKHQRDLLFTEHGLTPRFKVSDAISPWLNLVYSTEEYIPRDLAGNDFSFYVGHSFPMQKRGDESDFPFEKLRADIPKVYMSMGSQIYYHPQLFSAIVQAFAGDDIQLIFSINELYHTDFLASLPPSVIAVPYTPQLKLLPYVDLFITHGGANSVMEGLASGIPLALLPICNDQFLQAKFVTRAGVGVVLDPEEVLPQKYREQLLPMLKADAPERTKARAIAASFQQHGGAGEAATLIDALYQTRQPLYPR